jgi:nitrate/TMAO reductase-like tetraheme cytochrome c subunit
MDLNCATALTVAAATVEKQSKADPKCIGCHTVGFGTATGYRREFGAAKLADVGCESCHGPGSLHIRQRQGDASVNFTFRPLAAGDCIRCHYGEFSRPFVWDQMWPLIRIRVANPV